MASSITTPGVIRALELGAANYSFSEVELSRMLSYIAWYIQYRERESSSTSPPSFWKHFQKSRSSVTVETTSKRGFDHGLGGNSLKSPLSACSLPKSCSARLRPPKRRKLLNEELPSTQRSINAIRSTTDEDVSARNDHNHQSQAVSDHEVNGSLVHADATKIIPDAPIVEQLQDRDEQGLDSFIEAEISTRELTLTPSQTNLIRQLIKTSPKADEESPQSVIEKTIQFLHEYRTEANTAGSNVPQKPINALCCDIIKGKKTNRLRQALEKMTLALLVREETRKKRTEANFQQIRDDDLEAMIISEIPVNGQNWKRNLIIGKALLQLPLGYVVTVIGFQGRKLDTPLSRIYNECLEIASTYIVQHCNYYLRSDLENDAEDVLRSLLQRYGLVSVRNEPRPEKTLDVLQHDGRRESLGTPYTTQMFTPATSFQNSGLSHRDPTPRKRLEIQDNPAHGDVFWASSKAPLAMSTQSDSIEVTTTHQSNDIEPPVGSGSSPIEKSFTAQDNACQPGEKIRQGFDKPTNLFTGIQTSAVRTRIATSPIGDTSPDNGSRAVNPDAETRERNMPTTYEFAITLERSTFDALGDPLYALGNPLEPSICDTLGDPLFNFGNPLEPSTFDTLGDPLFNFGSPLEPSTFDTLGDPLYALGNPLEPSTFDTLGEPFLDEFGDALRCCGRNSPGQAVQ